MVKKIVILIILFTLTYAFLYFENSALVTTNLDLQLPGLPSGFNGYKILQISDLHGKEFGRSNKRLISTIKKISPDIIVITGDLIDAFDYNEEITLNFIDKIIDIYPIYFTTGNHEINCTKYFESLDKKLKEKGVYVLRNSTAIIQKNKDCITLIGLEDPQFIHKSDNDINKKIMSKELDNLIIENNKNIFKILLSHRPEQFELYSKYNINLIFSGHVHGGQFRLPFVGGFYAPNQGLFPKYDSGKYTLSNSTMIVSRGLGNGSIPQRIFNRPELIVVTLNKSN